MQPSEYPSCEFVERLVGSPGRVEHLQCLFIDWMLISKLAVVVDNRLTPLSAIDIIPPAMKDDLVNLSTRPFDEASHAEVELKYTNYLHKLRNQLLEQLKTMREEANAAPPTRKWKPVIRQGK